jgi:hypothetical protein
MPVPRVVPKVPPHMAEAVALELLRAVPSWALEEEESGQVTRSWQSMPQKRVEPMAAPASPGLSWLHPLL